MDVFFETQDGYKFEIELGYWDTVLEIKQKIEKYQRIPVSTQTLVFQGNVLQDHLDIEQCVILNHSLLKVFVAPYSSANNNNDQMLQTEKSPLLNSAKEIVNVQDLPVMVRSNKKVCDEHKGWEQRFEPSNLQRR
ncbi:LOW QUALITY PROTEIN: uncharacterized protein LOC110227232 [Arabidopsis lyrata subsp. lyrata]|uniref:LOW QUALITY PROTEIN: uncharacterized protein LOC110227232 n=1 Tax=Arabidopsis lyrata subsp. lyrata TaxID=81972 RepID=UPI000A29CA77|nr:LOW QUALITY PROTEIN: uncharacterized protein LOC110227232 [Arabidopsis lyrata subsp. lyrata]|eukprot:XP_020876490.1 LOW QUALITY PROTEIN: uncharacterized protein LOC110227232 [Arabidopsis lyrata subsp. lyrata]